MMNGHEDYENEGDHTNYCVPVRPEQRRSSTELEDRWGRMVVVALTGLMKQALT